MRLLTLTRILAWLRWKYIWPRAWGRRVGVIMAVFASLAFSAWIATLIYFAFRSAGEGNSDPGVISEYIILGSFVIYAGWLYVGTYNDLYDPQRLAPWPIAPWKLFTGACLSNFVGVTPLFVIAMIAGMIFGAEADLATNILRSGWICILGIHLVMFSRLMRLTFLQILTSRRWREFAGLLGVLVSGVVWMAMSNIKNIKSNESALAALQWIEDWAAGGNVSLWLAWSPSTWWGWAFQLEGIRAAGGAILFMITTILVGYAGGVSENRLAFSEPVFAYTPRAAGATGPRKPFLRGWPAGLLKFFRGDIAALARKEICIFSRDPLIRMRLISSLFMVIVIGVAPLMAGRRSMVAGTSTIGSILLFGELSFLFNLFGTDGVAIRAVLLSPVSRFRILLAKSLTCIALFLPINLLAISIFNYVWKSSAPLAAELVYHYCYFLLAVGAGHLFSIYFPSRLVQAGRRVQRDADMSPFLRMFIGIAALFSVGAAAAPVVVMYLISDWFGISARFILAGGSVLYSTVIYIISLLLAAQTLSRREEKLLTFFTQNN